MQVSACQQALKRPSGGAAFRRPQRRAQRASAAPIVECNTATAQQSTGVKLPATHIASSQAALRQVESSASKGINRKLGTLMDYFRAYWRGGRGRITSVAAVGKHQPALTSSLLVRLAGYAMEKKSSIIAIGLTVHNAPVELREKLAVPEAEWPRAIQELCSYPHIEEAAVLSTCNRMEIYVVGLSFHRGERRLIMSGGGGVSS